jgi:hypothetical protein
MSLKSLKREVEILSKALNPKVIPEWQKRSIEIQQLLKEYDALTEAEKAESTLHACKWYGELEK